MSKGEFSKAWETLFGAPLKEGSSFKGLASIKGTTTYKMFDRETMQDITHKYTTEKTGEKK